MKRKNQKIVGYVVFSVGIFAFGLLLYFMFLHDPSQSKQVEKRALDLHIPDAEQRQLPATPIEAYEEFEAELNMARQRRMLETADDGDIDLSRRGRGVVDSETPNVDVAVVPSRSVPVAVESNEKAIAQWNRTLAAVQQQEQQREEERRQAQTEAQFRREAEQRQREEQQTMINEQMRIQQEMLNAAMMAQYGGGIVQQEQQPLPTTPEQRDGTISEEIVVMPVLEQGDGIITSLRRSGGFHGTAEMAQRRNTIQATINGRQVVSEGQNVRIRLREPMQVGRMIVPIGSIVVGVVSIGVDRVFITIGSIENGGVITPVRLTAFDHDGQHGLFVPGSLENEALREIGAEIAGAIGSTASSSMSMFNQQSAMEQLQGDVMRGAVQGTARYAQRRISQVRVILQDNHRLFLVATN